MNNLVTTVNFRELVLQRIGLSMVNFYAEWNGASQMMIPVYEQMAAAYSSQAGFYSVDIDNDPSLKDQYGIMELPTVLFFNNGVLVDHVTGVISKNAFITKLENTLSSNKK